MYKNDITVKQAADIAVCYTHFVSLLFNNYPFYKIKKHLGKEVLKPFLITWNHYKNNH